MRLVLQSAVDVEAIAARLRAAYETRAPIAPLRDELPAGDVALAYAIQEANTKYWCAKGRRIVGRKVGLTSEAVQRQLGVDQPDYGMLFDDMQVADGGSTPSRTLLQPRIEAEIAFVMARDLTAEQPSAAQAAAAVAYALPALEIVDSRIRDWNIALVDTIADNASSGRFVVGKRKTKLSDVDVVACRMTLTRNGEKVSEGSGAACLGSPLNALAWLAQIMVQAGRPLRAGDVVLSGALGPLVPVKGGELYEASMTDLGGVSVAFE